jgi:hypothetical protein
LAHGAPEFRALSCRPGGTFTSGVSTFGVISHWICGFSWTIGITAGAIPSVNVLFSMWGSGANDLWAAGQLGTAGALARGVNH